MFLVDELAVKMALDQGLMESVPPRSRKATCLQLVMFVINFLQLVVSRVNCYKETHFLCEMFLVKMHE